MVTQVGYTNFQVVSGEARPAREPVAAFSTATLAQQAVSPLQAETVASEALPAVDAQVLDSAVKDVTRNVQTRQRSLQFSVDENSGRTIITVIDKETEEVIRQIPPEEVVALAQRVDRGGGMLIDAEA